MLGRLLLRSSTAEVPCVTATSTRTYAASAGRPVLVSERDEGRVKIVSFNAPASLNALTVDMGRCFRATMREISQDNTTRAVVLTGEGKAFSAGGDLDFLRERTRSAAQANSEAMRAFYARFLSLRDLPVPIISAVNGHAVGAGCCVALATDIRLMSTTGKIGMNFSRLGLHPGMGATHYVAKLVGEQTAAELLLTGRLLDAREAKELGLVSRVVEEPKDVLEEAVALATSIASNSPVAVRGLTKTLRQAQDVGLAQALQREADAQAHCYSAADLLEGIQAVVEKRAPKF